MYSASTRIRSAVRRATTATATARRELYAVPVAPYQEPAARLVSRWEPLDREPITLGGETFRVSGLQMRWTFSSEEQA